MNVSEVVIPSDLNVSHSQFDAQHEISQMKSMIVNEQNIPLIKEGLVKTMQHRLDMLRDGRIDLLENFPYFFSNPELVSELGFN